MCLGEQSEDRVGTVITHWMHKSCNHSIDRQTNGPSGRGWQGRGTVASLECNFLIFIMKVSGITWKLKSVQYMKCNHIKCFSFAFLLRPVMRIIFMPVCLAGELALSTLRGLIMLMSSVSQWEFEMGLYV